MRAERECGLMTDKGRVFPSLKHSSPGLQHVQQQGELSRGEISIQNKVTVSLKLSNVSSVLLSAEFVEGFVDSVN